MNETISWQALEYKPHDHDTGWYAGLFLFGAILVVWGLYTNNIIAVILFALIIFLVYSLSHQTPERVQVELSQKGIRLGKFFYAYDKLKKFWIVTPQGGTPELHVLTEAVLNKFLTIELEHQDPDAVRAYLQPHLEEVKGYKENFIDTMTRRLKL